MDWAVFPEVAGFLHVLAQPLQDLRLVMVHSKKSPSELILKSVNHFVYVVICYQLVVSV